LDAAIEALRRALPTRAPRVPADLQDDLRRAQEAEGRYERSGDLGTLDEAVAAWERVIAHPALPAAPEPIRSAAWNAAGCIYLQRYRAGGRPQDLNRALELWQAAVAAMDAGSPEKSMLFSNLGGGLRYRYARSG